MSAPTTLFVNSTGTITTSGEANGLLLPINGSYANPRVLLGFTGTFTSVIAAVRGRLAGTPNFYPIPGIVPGNPSALVTNNLSIALTDSTSQTLEFDVSGCDQLEVWAVSGTLTELTVNATQFPSGGTMVSAVNISVSGSQAITGATTITASSVDALAVGPNGVTNPTLQVVTNVGSQITGIVITGAASGAGVAIAAIGSAAEPLTLNAKGTGTIGIGSVSTGAVTITPATTITGAATLSSTLAANGNITLADTVNIIANATTGTKIGTATTQKLGLWNATPIVQPANTVDYVTGLVNVGLRASGGTASATFPGLVASAGSILSSSASGGIGYSTGAGGAVTQTSSRATGVTINTPTGAITLVSAAGSATPFSFTVTNSSVAALDTVVISQKSGTDLYTTQTVTNVAAGSFKLTLANASGTTTEQPVFNFAVVKGVAS